MDDATPIFILADDLTGALDSAAAFATRGISAFVALSGDCAAPAGTRVVSANADTRRLPAAEAAGALRQVITSVNESCGVLQFTKIDSTLRGHPGLEIAVAAEETGARLVLIAPSFPATGRIVRNGELLVHGVPLAETEVGRDPLSPARDSNVVAVLRQHCTLHVHSLSLDSIRSPRLGEELLGLMTFGGDAGPVLVVCDAETDQDLDALVLAGRHAESQQAESDVKTPLRVLLAGSAGLASSVARAVQNGPNNNVKTVPAFISPVLVVTASQRSLADEQIAELTDAGLAERWPVKFGEISSNQPGSVDVDMAAVGFALKDRRNVVLRATLETDFASRSAEAVRTAADSVTRQMGQLVSDLVSEHRIGGLVVIGGDTAFAVLSAVEARGIVLASEPLPGVALGTISGGVLDGVTIAAKAGAFGDNQTLVELLNSPAATDQQL